jgi:hypothetical protein
MTYDAAQRLARLADTADEQPYAQSALRVADHALAFAFTTALRGVEAHPPALSIEALKIQDRIRQSRNLLDADQQRVTELTGALAQAKTAAAAQKAAALTARHATLAANLDHDKGGIAELAQHTKSAKSPRARMPQQRPGAAYGHERHERGCPSAGLLVIGSSAIMSRLRAGLAQW